ncbi:MAG: hypothetical protein RL117_430 [Verrucomicrobiota bacterium]
MRKIAILWCASILSAIAQVDLWDLPPIRYADRASRDRLAGLAEKWQRDPSSLRGKTDVARLQEILRALGVPQESQILVYSKTSKQNALIHPGNPRALYFSLDCYVGYVPSGMVEVIIHDSQLGPVFYLIDWNRAAQTVHVERDTSDCLSCHGTGRTEHVPGLLVRSVFPDETGQPLLQLGSELVMHDTPIAKRWGGYYVTGSIALPHLGNQTFVAEKTAKPMFSELRDVKKRVPTELYPCDTSDVIALLVLEHQCHAHNLMTAARMNYERARFLSLSIAPDDDPDMGSAGRVAEQAAQRIVDWFLFRGEASLGDDGVTGHEAFQKAWTALVPQAANGDSLTDFQCHTRIFKNRCSYMMYSEAYRSLPDAIRRRVTEKIKNLLEKPAVADAYADIKASERRRILKILRDTGVL